MKGMEQMDLNLISGKKTVLIKINTELDHHAAEEIRKKADEKIKTSNAVNIIFDFTNVDFMDSSGIGVIIGRYKLCKVLGGKVIIYGICESIERIIKMSGIDKLVEICNTQAEAISKL